MEFRPLVVDLCCGLGGWSAPFYDRGCRVVGIDLVRHEVRGVAFRGELRIEDVRGVDGTEFRGALVVLASPPCVEFVRHSAWHRARFPGPRAPVDLTVVRACFEIASVAGAPLVLENVRAAFPFLGPSVTRWGAQYLWGDGVPALIPYSGRGSGKELIWGSDRTKRALRSMIPRELAEFVADWYLGPVAAPSPGA